MSRPGRESIDGGGGTFIETLSPFPAMIHLPRSTQTYNNNIAGTSPSRPIVASEPSLLTLLVSLHCWLHCQAAGV